MAKGAKVSKADRLAIRRVIALMPDADPADRRIWKALKGSPVLEEFFRTARKSSVFADDDEYAA